MNYLTLEDIKQQLRINELYAEDDTLLEGLGDAAESYLSDYLDTNLDVIAAQNSGELPQSLYRAMLILVSYLYDNDGSGETREIPKAFYMLTCLYKKYPIA